MGRNGKFTDYSVSISIVTCNSEEHIGEVLDTLFAHSKAVSIRVFVIDNCSTDQTIAIIKGKPYDITLIQNEKNIGFSAGHNQMLPHMNSKYHACVNPDIFIKNDVVSALAAYMDKHDDIGIVTPKVLHPDGSVQLLPKRNPRMIYLLARRISLRFLKKYRERYEMLEKGHDKPFDIEFSSGCFMFLRADVFKKVGGFDERYFLYFEDADLTRSIRRYARAEYNPSFEVYHYWDRAGARKLRFLLMQIHSMVKYLLKWRKDR